MAAGAAATVVTSDPDDIAAPGRALPVVTG
jgi:hypothetical protein